MKEHRYPGLFYSTHAFSCITFNLRLVSIKLQLFYFNFVLNQGLFDCMAILFHLQMHITSSQAVLFGVESLLLSGTETA